ncbi:putative Serine/arginine-rich splicing factor 1 [Hypsibius exemplaris]|uniref:Serine/arginine-rich splicing factor 1 n=1 Tax=Hypsibius exemplaris TaxID=2072580 RepID=A0A1W0WGG6_HYPEX|nr:putative Serine/arginine-rich splicing factor 1 [Hypsibius exemplaris]
MGRVRLYVGNLPATIRERDIEDIFGRYGKIDNMNLRTDNRHSFAFLDYDHSSDAEAAIRGEDRTYMDGLRIRVEYSHTSKDGNRRDSHHDDRGGRGRGLRPNTEAIRRSTYRAYVSGLPNSTSWQDLKDHMRDAGDIGFADVYSDGTGCVEYLREEDLKYAIKKLDDTKIRARGGKTAYIKVSKDEPVRSEGGSRRRSRTRSRSPSKDRRRGGSSRSRSPVTRRRSGSPSTSAKGEKDRRSERKRERSASRSPKRRSSRSPKRSRRTRSRSPTNGEKAKRERGHRSTSEEGQSKRSRSRSPVERAASPKTETSANGNGAAKKEGSASPPSRARSHSASPAHRPAEKLSPADANGQEDEEEGSASERSGGGGGGSGGGGGGDHGHSGRSKTPSKSRSASPDAE